MIIQDKQELIYRNMLVILFIVFIAIFYMYSENGRYAYFHKEIVKGIGTYKDIDVGWKVSVLDTRTGTIYQHNFEIAFPGGAITNTFFKEKMATGRFFEAKAGGKYEELK
ncbi:MAG: hypothetical protein WB948_15525 [Desulfobaccales bacterium]